MSGELGLLGGGGALVAGFPGLDHFLVFHPVGVVLKVLDLSLDLLLFGFLQAGFEFGQGGNDVHGSIVPDLLEQRGDPGAGLGSAPAMEIVGDGPEVFIGMLFDGLRSVMKVGSNGCTRCVRLQAGQQPVFSRNDQAALSHDSIDSLAK